MRFRAAVAVTFLVASATAVSARTADPQYSSEIGFGFTESDQTSHVSGRHAYFVHYTPSVQLDGDYPNDLQPLAQRASAYAAMFSHERLGAPYSDVARSYSFSAMDFVEKSDVGLTAQYASVMFDNADLTQDTFSFGLIFDSFPTSVVSVTYGIQQAMIAGAEDNSDQITVAVGDYLSPVRLWWEASYTAAWGSIISGEYSTLRGGAVLYLNDRLGVGASISNTAYEADDDTTTALGLALRFSHLKFYTDVETAFDLEADGDSSFAFSLGYRY